MKKHLLRTAAMAAISWTVWFGFSGCATEPMTDIPKFREYKRGDEGGLEFVRYMTVREALEAGYLMRDGEWIRREDIEREQEAMVWEGWL